jgi:ketosteroid isomerase-like protein
MTYDRNAELAVSFLEAFNERAMERFLATLAPDIEVHTRRAIYRGREEAARWCERPLEHLTLEIESRQLMVGTEWAIATGTARARWRRDGSVAEEAPTAALWLIGAAGIRRWRSFDSLADALAAAGMDQLVVAT